MIPLSHRSPVPLDICHLARAVDVIGDRWTLLILRSAMFGVRRFDDFQQELSIPRTVLSGRLKALTAGGLLEKRAYKVEGKRARPEYLMTDKGQALQPILIALTQWSDDWLAEGAKPPMGFSHAETRQRIRAAFIDENGREVAVDQIRLSLRR